MDPTFKGLGVPTPVRMPAKSFDIRRGLLFGGIVVAVVIIVSLVVSTVTAGPTNELQRMLYRLDALSTLTINARGSISSDELSKVNASLSLILEGDNVAIKKVISPVQLNSTLSAIKTEETDTASTDKLQTAKLNADYDSTYRAIVTQKVEATSALATELLDKVSSSQQKTALTTLRTHLDTYDAQLKSL